jgi:hypothetical protein
MSVLTATLAVAGHAGGVAAVGRPMLEMPSKNSRGRCPSELMKIAVTLTAHAGADVGRHQGRGIIDAIADHCLLLCASRPACVSEDTTPRMMR